jgi:hypothetical protein
LIVKLSSIPQKLIENMRKRLSFPNELPLHELNRAYYDVSSFSSQLNGIMLSKQGISVEFN